MVTSSCAARTELVRRPIVAAEDFAAVLGDQHGQRFSNDPHGLLRIE